MQTDTKQQAREAILRYLRNINAEAPFEHFIPLYHLHYPTYVKQGKYRYKRMSRVTLFLAAMESDGLIRCTYDRTGNVVTAKLP